MTEQQRTDLLSMLERAGHVPFNELCVGLLCVRFGYYHIEPLSQQVIGNWEYLFGVGNNPKFCDETVVAIGDHDTCSRELDKFEAIKNYCFESNEANQRRR